MPIPRKPLSANGAGNGVRTRDPQLGKLFNETAKTRKAFSLKDNAASGALRSPSVR